MRNLKSIILIFCICLPFLIFSCRYKDYDKKPVWEIGRYVIDEINSGEFTDIEKYIDHLVKEKPSTVNGKRILEELYQFVAERLSRRDMLDKWCSKEAPHHSSFIFRGVYYTVEAWKARGRGFSYTVTPEGRQKFYEYLELAEKDFEKAYSINPLDPNSSAFMIRVCMGISRSEFDMDIWFRRAIEADPASYNAYVKKTTYLRPKWHGTPEKDLAFSEYCYENAPPESIVHEIMLDYIIEKYKWTKNKKDYYNDPVNKEKIDDVVRRTLKDFPDSASLRIKLAQIETDQGNNQKAAQFYSDILEISPDNPEALRMRGQIYNGSLQKPDLAEADIMKALEVDPYGPHNYAELARISILKGKREEAIDYYTRAIEKSPKELRYYIMRGMIKMRDLQDYAAALKDFKEVLRMDNIFLPANFNIAICLEKMQQYEEAKKYCMKTLSILEARKPGEGVRSIPPAMAANYSRTLNAMRARLDFALRKKSRGTNETGEATDRLHAAMHQEQVDGLSVHEGYGLSEKSAIKVAGMAGSGPGSERAYLNMLCGPDGEKIKYRRTGSCCHFNSPNSPFAMLDMYEVTYDGLDKPVIVYLNMYDPPEGRLIPPAGLKMKNEM